MDWSKGDEAMNETMVKIMSDYGAIGIAIVLVGLCIWLIKYFVKQQTKDREGIMGLLQNELKDLHNDSLMNADLNRSSISMLGTLTEYLNRHFNGCTDKVNFEKKTNEKG
jgi:hypothetical protein